MKVLPHQPERSPCSTLRSPRQLGWAFRMLLPLAAVMSSACVELPEPSSLGDDGGRADAGAQLDGGGNHNHDASGAHATGRIELLGATWLTDSTIAVRFSEVSRTGDPFLAVYSELSPNPVTEFGIPFVEGELIASGTHTFDPLPVGRYVVRLVHSTDQVLQEVPFTVRADSDGDGTADGEDACPTDPAKASQGMCGCGIADDDADGDSTPDCIDACPDNSGKIAAGMCGCEIADDDVDGDTTPDCIDACPDDAMKVAAGTCGCDVAEDDSDGDGTADCVDACPSDAGKTALGVCGCGVADTDTDRDGTANCTDLCPTDRNKTEPGTCGCGLEEGTCLPPDCSNQLLANVAMLPGDQRCSANGQFNFGMDANGYLTFREGSTVIWSAFQSGVGASMKLQGDGNLVVRSSTGAAVWASATAGKTGAVLTVEDDGSVVLRVLEVVVWKIGPFESGDTLCREARENQLARLQCPAGQTISAIEFASYGKPTGSCGSFAVDTACHFNAESLVETDCLGENACEFLVDKADFTVPCSGTKRLVVAYSCSADACPQDPAKEAPGICGCGVADTDSDGDGRPNCTDACPADPAKIAAGVCGCGVADTDSDGDGIANCTDVCPTDPSKSTPGACGCGVAETDGDSDGVPNCTDACPADPSKIAVGACGCGTADTDTDGDGAANCVDECPLDPNKTAPGACGCGTADTDGDGDGTPTCGDLCPADPNKLAPGVCGCGTADTDTDSDGTLNCQDQCPADGTKTAPGVCGCGTADTDTDSDGTLDCQDICPADPAKTEAGVCGCGIADTDSDNDGSADCDDACAADPEKTEAGVCGCGIAEDNCPPACTHELLPSTQLAVGEKRCSQNGRFSFGLNAEGYLTLREGSTVVWTAYQVVSGSSAAVPAVIVRLQSDGNLVARSSTNAAVWSSATAGKNGAILSVEDDGSVVLRHLDLVVWSIGPFQSGDTRCREVRENRVVQLSCPAGQTVSSIDFASYGKPTGACGGYAIDALCHFDAQSLMETSCVGESSCEILVDKADFTIPCSGAKRLAVAYSCGAE